MRERREIRRGGGGEKREHARKREQQEGRRNKIVEMFKERMGKPRTRTPLNQRKRGENISNQPTKKEHATNRQSTTHTHTPLRLAGHELRLIDNTSQLLRAPQDWLGKPLFPAEVTPNFPVAQLQHRFSPPTPHHPRSEWPHLLHGTNPLAPSEPPPLQGQLHLASR